MPVYPDARLITRMTFFQREALLPEAATGTVLVSEGQAVDIRNPVARGSLPSEHIIMDARPVLGSVNDAALRRLLLVKEGAPVARGDPIAGKDARRGRRIFAPADGAVVFAGEGRIILQTRPQVVTVEAGVRGDVTAVYPGRGVSLRGSGTLVQGVWGNGRSLINSLRLEPASGLESLSPDSFDSAYKNEIVITARPITARVLQVAEGRGFGAIIAPSMSAGLLAQVQRLEMPVMLTEGFGAIRMNPAIVALLQELDGLQATLDAAAVASFEPRRPQLVISRRPGGEEEPAAVDTGVALRRGMRVRSTRPPFTGELGKVIDLPEMLITLPGGLRTLCARVDTGEAEPVEIPLANLELAGR